MSHISDLTVVSILRLGETFHGGIDFSLVEFAEGRDAGKGRSPRDARHHRACDLLIIVGDCDHLDKFFAHYHRRYFAEKLLQASGTRYFGEVQKFVYDARVVLPLGVVQYSTLDLLYANIKIKQRLQVLRARPPVNLDREDEETASREHSGGDLCYGRNVRPVRHFLEELAGAGALVDVGAGTEDVGADGG